MPDGAGPRRSGRDTARRRSRSAPGPARPRGRDAYAKLGSRRVGERRARGGRIWRRPLRHPPAAWQHGHTGCRDIAAIDPEHQRDAFPFLLLRDQRPRRQRARCRPWREVAPEQRLLERHVIQRRCERPHQSTRAEACAIVLHRAARDALTARRLALAQSPVQPQREYFTKCSHRDPVTGHAVTPVKVPE